MSNDYTFLQCYNRGCGQQYDPNINNKDSCRYHPGNPIFHDAYKGWDCCNKKCTDFTEFLNIKGCTTSEHSNIKPLEPEKPVIENVPDTNVIKRHSTDIVKLERPHIDTPLCTLRPKIALSLKHLIDNVPQNDTNSDNFNEVSVGTVCKNGGCNVVYQKTNINDTVCIYHPGVPIFHEGMKYWSCCQKKTSDFNSFLNQVGCEKGNHVWKKNEQVQCRWDFHQTPSHVFVSIYAKHYCPMSSIIKLHPIRLYSNLNFPQQSCASFILDFELSGIVNVEESEVSMYGSKIEIKMKKACPGTWLKLGESLVNSQEKKQVALQNITTQVEAVNLDDL